MTLEMCKNRCKKENKQYYGLEVLFINIQVQPSSIYFTQSHLTVHYLPGWERMLLWKLSDETQFKIKIRMQDPV